MSTHIFLSGPILPALLRFSVPVFLSLALQALYGAVDLWAVGVFGDAAGVSAVAIGSQTMQIVTGLVTGLSMGTTILIGREVGRGSPCGAARAVGASVWVFGVLGVAASAALVPAAPWIAALMDTPPEAFRPTVLYVRVCGAGTVFIAAFNVLSAIFRGLGDAKSPLVYVAIACVANVVGDVAFVAGFGMGPLGAAIATVLAQALSVGCALAHIARRGLSIPFSVRDFRLRPRVVRQTLRLGSPLALQDACTEISYLAVIGFVNTLGVIASAGVGVAEKLGIFIFLVPMSCMQAVSAFVAQNAGAGLFARARRVAWIGVGAASVPGVLLAYALAVHGDALSRIFTSDPGVLRASTEFLRATAAECLILSVAHCLSGYFNGLGRTTFVMAQGLAAVFLVRIPFAWWASARPEPDVFTIGLSSVLAAAFVLVANLVFYARLKSRAASPFPKSRF